MKPCHPLSLLPIAASTHAYYEMSIYAPLHPELHGEVIHANGMAFVVGAKHPTTSCDLEFRKQCPDGFATLVNSDLTSLAASVPGGQFIYVGPDGIVSYPAAHSALRPPWSQVGGFYSFQVLSSCDSPSNVVSWQSEDGQKGLWACANPKSTDASKKILMANVAGFEGEGCFALDGIQITEAGNDYAAWAYT